MLKAALAAASEPLRDTHKLIHQRHLDEGIRDVIAGKRVMKQSLFDGHHAASGDGARYVVRDHPAPHMYVLLLSVGALVIALIALLVALR